MTTKEQRCLAYGYRLLVAATAGLVAACSAPANDGVRLAEPDHELVRQWATADPATQTAQTLALSTDTAPMNVEPVADLIGGLEARLARQPDDVKGWSLLAQSYAFTNQPERAAEALEQAVLLGANRAELAARIEREAR